MSQVYQWPVPGNETPMIGRKVQVDRLLFAAEGHGGAIEIGRYVLMLPEHRTVAEWVRESDLTPYPSEPIEEPTK